jgi:hypothetical protein
MRVESPETPRSTQSPRQSSPVHVERCCNCSKSSTFQTKRCACFKAATPCLSCDCIDKCCNKWAHKFYGELSTPSTPETDESSVFVKEEGSSTSTATPVRKIEGGPKLIDADPPPLDRVPAEAKSDEEAESVDPITPSEAKRMEGRRGENAVGDLPGAIVSDADRMLDKVYGDHVHENPGTYLNGGIEDDAMWQRYHRRLIVYPSQRYDAPNGNVGHCLVETMTSLFEGIRSRKWNSERFLLFQIVLLQQTREVT